jgi:hypothetical protein
MEDNKEEEDDDNYPEFPEYGDIFMGEAKGKLKGGSSELIWIWTVSYWTPE